MKLQGKHTHDCFDDFNEAIREGIAKSNAYKAAWFTVGNVDLWTAYLAAFPFSHRKHHDCRCCESFIRKYGALVRAEGGEFKSIWSGVATRMRSGQSTPMKRIYAEVAERLNAHVMHAIHFNKPTLALIEPDVLGYIGSSITGQFSHFYMQMPEQNAKKVRKWKEADERMSYFNCSQENARKALVLLTGNKITNGSVAIRQAHFLHSYLCASPIVKMLMLVDAQESETHPNNSVIGKVIRDIELGLSDEKILSNYEQLVDPLKYQRPTAPVAQQHLDNISEEFYEKGYDRAMKRKWFDVHKAPEAAFLWTKAPPESDSKRKRKLKVTEVNTTLKDFLDKHLASATEVQVLSRHVSGFLTEAADETAPPVLMWDHEYRRNTVSWYMDLAEKVNYGVDPINVSSIIKNPSAWFGTNNDEFKDSIFLLLETKPQRVTRHTGLFPQLLGGHMHKFKRVVEHLNSKKGPTEPVKDGAFCIQLRPGLEAGLLVTTPTSKVLYHIS